MADNRAGNAGVQKELEAIKRLLVLQLITSGVQATDVARTLRVDNSVVSRMVPARKVKKAARGR